MVTMKSAISVTTDEKNPRVSRLSGRIISCNIGDNIAVITAIIIPADKYVTHDPWTDNPSTNNEVKYRAQVVSIIVRIIAFIEYIVANGYLHFNLNRSE